MKSKILSAMAVAALVSAFCCCSPAQQKKAQKSATPAPAPDPRQTAGYLEQRDSGRFEETFNIMAGGVLTVDNNDYEDIEIRSTYPVDISFGNCNETGTVDYECRTEAPTSIRVVDSRRGMSPLTNPANAIHVIGKTEPTPKPTAKDFPIRAGKTLHINNSKCRDIKVHSPQAVSIRVGECYDVAAYDFECKTENPTDVYIRDHRNPEEGVNIITVTCGQ